MDVHNEDVAVMDSDWSDSDWWDKEDVPVAPEQVVVPAVSVTVTNAFKLPLAIHLAALLATRRVAIRGE